MADNPRYQQSGIGLASTGALPTVDPIGSRARAASYGNIADVLDRMASSAFKTAVEEAERQGMMWGAQNAVTVDQLNAAVAIGNDPLAERSTHFGNAARKVQATVLANNLNAQGVQEMARIQAEAEVGNITLSAAAEKMDAVSNAYAQTLTQIDPETGIKLRAAMTTHSASVYKHLAGEEVKKVLAAQKVGIDEFFAKLPKSLETIYLAGDQVGADGIVKTADDLVQVQRAHAIQAARITGDASYGTKFDKAVSEAKINAVTRFASSPEFSTSSVAAMSKMNAGDMGSMNSTWANMTEEERMKAKQNFMQQKGSEYTLKERAEKDDKDARGRQLSTLVSAYYLTDDPNKRRDIGRQIAVINAQGIGGPVYEPGTIKALTKPDDGEATPLAEVRAIEMIDRQGITDLNEIQKRTGITGKTLVKVQNHLYSKGDQHLNREIKTLASIPDGIVQMTGDQQRRFQALNDEAEILKRKSITEKGSYDPYEISKDLRQRRDDITREKQADADKERLANYTVMKGGKVLTMKLTADTSVEEMKRMGIGDAEIANIQRIQARVRGK